MMIISISKTPNFSFLTKNAKIEVTKADACIIETEIETGMYWIDKNEQSRAIRPKMSLFSKDIQSSFGIFKWAEIPKSIPLIFPLI